MTQRLIGIGHVRCTSAAKKNGQIMTRGHLRVFLVRQVWASKLSRMQQCLGHVYGILMVRDHVMNKERNLTLRSHAGGHSLHHEAAVRENTR
jgi:hypothetical protein